MFKPGDKVICISARRASVLVPLKEYIIKDCDGNYVHLKDIKQTGPWSVERFKLAPVMVEEAKELLRQKGYTVIPPPEPRKGTVFVVQNTTTKRIIPFSEGIWETFDIEYKQQYKILAIVPWTEGDGLEI